jgi:hypothetical protein
MNPVFLSASVPYPKKDVPRNAEHVKTADPIAIRDAVMALLEVVLPHTELYFGGHPAITPMVRRVAERRELLGKVKNYQSQWFLDKFPKDNEAFPHLIITPSGRTLDDSLVTMRTRMLKMLRPKDVEEAPPKGKFVAAFFIGGMKGVLDEYQMFRDIHGPAPPCFPVGTTGGAALDLLNDRVAPESAHTRLATDTNYVPLFRELLGIK